MNMNHSMMGTLETQTVKRCSAGVAAPARGRQRRRKHLLAGGRCLLKSGLNQAVAVAWSPALTEPLKMVNWLAVKGDPFLMQGALTIQGN